MARADLHVLTRHASSALLTVMLGTAANAPAQLLAFLGVSQESDARRQVYRVPLRGGEPRPLTDAPTDIHAFAFSPDGRSLAYLAPQEPSDSVRERERAGYDAVIYGEPRLHVRLWVKNLSGGAPRPITPADRTVRTFAWAPDGKVFALQVTEGTDRESDYNFRRLYTVPAEGGELTLLARTEGPMGNMAWSPDGKRLALIGATSVRDPVPQSVFVVPIGGGEVADRTAGYEGSAIWVGWLNSGTILFGAIEGTRTVINQVGAVKRPIERLIGGGPTSFVFIGAEIDAGVSLDANARTFAAPMTTATHPEEVHVGTTDGQRLTRLTNHNGFIDSVRLARQETIEWESTDGLRIEGVLLHPLQERPGVRYPLVVIPHGGPELADLDAWWVTWPQSPAQVFAAHGYAVLNPNYRGSIGRGVVL